MYSGKPFQFRTLNAQSGKCATFERIMSCVNSVGFQLDPVVGNAMHLTGLCRHHGCGRLVICLSIPEKENEA